MLGGEEIIKEMEVLRSVVADHTKKWKHLPLSFADFCTVIVPPKFCSLKVPDNPPEIFLFIYKEQKGLGKKFERKKVRIILKLIPNHEEWNDKIA